ncbi:hypothetical protein [Phaeospirillum tilakii]|uniref:Thioesterase superfamily protein n=1 Tax=Phaeospirillum tilakii TaxID=741673 RepID=A0ABW5C805_9PROT
MGSGLEMFACRLGAELDRATATCRDCWPQVRIASLEVEFQTRLKAGADGVALQVMSDGRSGRERHALTILLDGDPARPIEARIDGVLVARYPRQGGGG